MIKTITLYMHDQDYNNKDIHHPLHQINTHPRTKKNGVPIYMHMVDPCIGSDTMVRNANI
jgi:hypothetical protein